jgi:hypothetical protein
MFEDCNKQKVEVGDWVGIAFSYSRASVGYIRVGTVESLEPEFKMRWANDKVSPPMVYNPVRVIRLPKPLDGTSPV